MGERAVRHKSSASRVLGLGCFEASFGESALAAAQEVQDRLQENLGEGPIASTER